MNSNSIYTLLLLVVVLVADSVSGFSVATPPFVGGDVFDKSLRGIDDNIETVTFDPTEGDCAPLTRNNKDEVWLPQVRQLLNFPRLKKKIVMCVCF